MIFKAVLVGNYAIVSTFQVMYRHTGNVKVVSNITVMYVELEVPHSYLVVLTVHSVEQTQCAYKCVFICNSVVYNVLAEFQADYAPEAEA